MGAVEKQADGRAFRLEAELDEGVDVDVGVHFRMIDALPGHRLGGFVTIFAAQIGVGQKQEQVLKILDTAPHQVGEYRLYFNYRRRASRHQVFIPFLVAGTGN